MYLKNNNSMIPKGNRAFLKLVLSLNNLQNNETKIWEHTKMKC
jgi:hypothetical protein